jgi:LuxR family maltose regulon positive regulatory protein
MKNQPTITSHETRILGLLKRGLTNDRISAETRVSVNTVKYHLKNIYRKLGVTNRVEAINKFNEMINP